jgi:FkbM family methyltransferase
MTRHAKNLLKRLLAIIPRDAVVPMFGANLGMWWVIGSANYNNWLGRDEKEIQKSFKKHVKKGYVVYDVGSNVGFYALLASPLVGLKGKVYAFEPVPKIFDRLTKHISINNLKNVEANQLAISDKSGRVAFKEGQDTSTGRMAETGDMEVDALSLDDFVARRNAPLPDFVKIDVEGHELNVLRGMSKILDSKKDIVIVLEADEDRSEVVDFLKGKGYALSRLDSANMIATR